MLVRVVTALLVFLSSLDLASAALANVYTQCSRPNVVALTFDDGPYIFHQSLVDTLQRYGVRATFFVNGKNWDCIYDNNIVTAIRDSYAKGNEFGSHTWAHKDLTTLSPNGPGGIHDEMSRVELALQRILGVQPALMRPPYGSYNNGVRTVASLRNQSVVDWDFDSGDSTGISVDQQKANYQNVANNRPSTILALNHETYESTYKDVIPFAIETLRARGYQFVTVSECLGIPAYQWTGPQQTRTASWNCN